MRPWMLRRRRVDTPGPGARRVHAAPPLPPMRGRRCTTASGREYALRHQSGAESAPKTQEMKKQTDASLKSGASLQSHYCARARKMAYLEEAGSPSVCPAGSAHSSKVEGGQGPTSRRRGHGCREKTAAVCNIVVKAKKAAKDRKLQRTSPQARERPQSTSSNASKKSKKKGNDTYRLPGTPKSSEDPLGAKFSTCARHWAYS
jgi:hypothetical protein